MDLDIPSDQIVEAGRFDRTPPYDTDDAITLYATSPEYTDPLLLVDGISRISVVAETDERYLIHYHGYESGYARVTEAGVRQFGTKYLADEEGIPTWYVCGYADETVELPRWVPDSYTPRSTVECDRCHTAVPIPEVVTPGRHDGTVVDWFCQDCWADVSDRWSQDWVHAGQSDILRAEYLDQTVGDAPATADIDELIRLSNSEADKAQMHALTALGRLIPERTDDIVPLLPVLAEKLTSDILLTRFCTLSCMTKLAEHQPTDVLPYVEDILPLLDPASDGGIHEESIRFVAALSSDYPDHVQNAAPKLATLLHEDPPEKQALLGSLTEIANKEPEAAIPAITDLCEYVARESEGNRIRAVAAIGYVAKAAPEAAEDAIPTMIDLLESPDNRLRANAAGVLADLAEAYPETLLFDLSKITILLDDPDTHAQHSGTYIIAQLAEQYPEEVESTVESLLVALDTDHVDTRINICRALGYIGDDEAVPTLEHLRDTDPDEEVRQTAGWALGQFVN